MKRFFHFVIKRFIRRLKNAFRLKEMYNHSYESCERCGNTYNIFYDLNDFMWDKIIGKPEGCFCIDCLCKLAEKKDIHLEIEDFNYIEILDKGDSYGRTNNRNDRVETLHKIANIGIFICIISLVILGIAGFVNCILTKPF